MRWALRIASCVVVAGSLLLASCDDESDIEPGTSTFDGAMTGAYTATLAGEAAFGVTLGENLKANGLALVLGDGGVARILLRTSGTPEPPPRTYEIVAPDFPAGNDTVFTATLAYVVNGAVEQFEAGGGTLTLTTSNHLAVAGTFELRAVRTAPCCDPVPVEIVITGTFDAAQISQVY